ncbi:PilN domain-containing protein [Planctomycetota bacterium]
MVNMNFVPDDYVENSESHKTNLMYLVLFVVVMVLFGGSFLAIKARQMSLETQEKLVNEKIAKAQKEIKQFEDLQSRRKSMMKTALTTAELLEPVPRSVLLALLTNDLPTGVSLLKLEIVQKEPKKTKGGAKKTSNYKKSQAGKGGALSGGSGEKLLETHISIEGIAPSDLHVASYIGHLSGSALLETVALIESKEKKIDKTAYRQFKLTTKLAGDVHLSAEDVGMIARRD